MKMWMLQYLLCFCSLLLHHFNTAISQSIVKTLPGYPGNLPFKLETGYIGVGENDDVQLFYYFIESENDPQKDPLMLWHTGGPGCSSFFALFYEIGPLAFDLANFDGIFPSIVLNPYSWTKIANIIFIDWPAGTGFSYANTSEGYRSSDTKSVKDNYTFMRKWLSIHPIFTKNPLYIGGDSYGGKIVPMLALEIAKGIEAGIEPRMLLQGYIVGNAMTDVKKDENEKIAYAHRVALISDELFELAKSSCRGEYTNPDPNNLECFLALQLVKQCTNLVLEAHILEPKCMTLSSKPTNDYRSGDQTLLEDDPVDDLIFLSKQDKPWCRDDNYVSGYVWANNKTVQEALHVRKGTLSEWKRCNYTSHNKYESDVESVFRDHQLLSEKGFRALAYSGDHDMIMPYMSTLKWIRELNLTVDVAWRAWTVNGQVAGYTEIHKNIEAYLTFATVKGAGHTPPEYMPKECFAMFERWLGLYPL